MNIDTQRNRLYDFLYRDTDLFIKTLRKCAKNKLIEINKAKDTNIDPIPSPHEIDAYIEGHYYEISNDAKTVLKMTCAKILPDKKFAFLSNFGILCALFIPTIVALIQAISKEFNATDPDYSLIAWSIFGILTLIILFSISLYREHAHINS